MKELNKAREEAKRIIDLSDDYIVITPHGASTYCNGKAHLMAMLCTYLKAQRNRKILSDEEIDEVVRVSRLDEDDVDRLIDTTEEVCLEKTPDEYDPENYKSFVYLRDCAIMEILYATGMRISELVNLDIKDIDFKNKTARVTGKVPNREWFF